MGCGKGDDGGISVIGFWRGEFFGFMTWQIIRVGHDGFSGFLFEFTAGVARDRAAFVGSLFALRKTLCVTSAGNFGRSCFTEHGEDEFKVTHVIPQVLALEALEFGILAGRHAEGGLGDFGGENGILDLFFHTAFFPFIGQFVPDSNGAHPFLDPVVGIALGFVERAGRLVASSGSSISCMRS